MQPGRLRILPTLALGGLLLLVARAQSAGGLFGSPACVAPVGGVVSGTATFVPGVSAFRVVQPDPATPTADGIQLGLRASAVACCVTYTAQLVLWDPETGGSDTESVPFESWNATLTADYPLHEYSRPMVLRTRTTTASPTLTISVVDETNTTSIDYNPQGAPNRAPFFVQLGGAVTVTASGPHPMLAYSMCDAGDADRDLEVVRQILSAPVPITPTAELAQEFDLDAPANLEWVELALPRFPSTPIKVAIYDMAGVVSPPEGGVPPVVQTGLFVPPDDGRLAPSWVATQRFAPQHLNPGRYVLVVSSQLEPVELRGHDAAQDGVDLPGRAWHRQGPGSPWVPDPDFDLAFRLIGTPDAGPAPSCTGSPLSSELQGTAAVQLADGDRIAQLFTSAPSRMPHCASLFVQAGGRLPHPTDNPLLLNPVLLMEFHAVENGVPAPGVFPLAVAYGTPCTCTGTLDPRATGWRTFELPRQIVLRMPITTPAEPDVDFALVFSSHSGVTQLPPGQPVEEPPGLMYRPNSPGPGGATYTARLERQGVWEPLPGASPSLVYSMDMATCCPSDPVTPTVELQSLRADSPIEAPTTTALLQSFTVQHECAVRWVELAIPGGQSPASPIQLSIMAARPGGPVTVPTETATLLVDDHTGVDVWMASEQFATVPVLIPGQEYWLLAETANQWRVGATNVTETATFGGLLWKSDTPGGPFSEVPGHVLALRLITTAVKSPTDAAADGLQVVTLRAGPNPFRGALVLQWKGGQGRARLDIVDVRGRLVRRVPDVGSARDGVWRWDGRDDHGRSTSSGLYFARLTDATGARHIARVVRVQ